MALYNKKKVDLSPMELAMEGKVVNLLLVLYEYIGDPPSEYDKWVCQCKCGNILIVDGRNLRKPKAQRSCGCQLHPRNRHYKIPGKYFDPRV